MSEKESRQEMIAGRRVPIPREQTECHARPGAPGIANSRECLIKLPGRVWELPRLVLEFKNRARIHEGWPIHRTITF